MKFSSRLVFPVSSHVSWGWSGKGKLSGWDFGMNACSYYVFTDFSPLRTGQEQQGCLFYMMFLSVCHSLLGYHREAATATWDVFKENVRAFFRAEVQRVLYTVGYLEPSRVGVMTSLPSPLPLNAFAVEGDKQVALVEVTPGHLQF